MFIIGGDKIKKKIFIKQDGVKNCGVTCLLMIIKYYGGYVPKMILEEMTKTTKTGTNAYNLIEASKKLGFESYGINYELDMDTPFLPAIAHVVINNYNHFVVIYEINKEKKYLIIADPAFRLKKISFEEFNKIFTNKLLIFYPIKKIVKYNRPKILPFLKKILFTKKFFLSSILTFVVIVLSLLFLVYIKQLLNLNNNVILPIIIIIFLKYLIGILKDYYIINYNKHINTGLNVNIYKNILSLPYAFYKNHTTGETISRIQGMENVNQIVGLSLLIISDVLIILATGIMLFMINKILFLISMITALIYLLNYYIYNKKITEVIEDLKIKKSTYTSYITESILGFESIKGQNLKNYFLTSFEKVNANYLDLYNRYQKMKSKISNILSLISDLLPVILIFVGSILISKKSLDLQTLILFYIILTYFLNPLQSLFETIIIFKDIKISLERIFELNIKQKINQSKKIGNIEFKDVSFKLEDKNILNKINLTIKKKDKIMFIGKSGSGKSSILKILKQYYKAKNIYVDNTNLNSLNFCDNVTYISQNEYLFTDTILNNITMGKGIKKEELNKIINICELKELIKRDQLGLNSLIEENGFNLSGGERQRIILARSLVNIKEYLFIDEGLSEVDINLERKIIKKLLKFYKNKTIIIVSHRIDNIDLFDKIIKLEEKLELIEKNKGGVSY